MNGPCVASIGEWVRTLAAAISPILVVIGWWWVNRQSNGREKRKELRQLIDRTIKLVSEAVDLGAKYHGPKSSGDSTTHLDAWKLTLGLVQIAGHIQLLRERGLAVQSSQEPYLQLKYALTGGDFQTASWKPWAPNDRRWMDVSNATNGLTHALDSMFFTTFTK